jgi:hypothetical protein
LADLITRTLKRNPKERIDYDEFFNHPFLRKSKQKKSIDFVLIEKIYFSSSTCKYIIDIKFKYNQFITITRRNFVSRTRSRKSISFFLFIYLQIKNRNYSFQDLYIPRPFSRQIETIPEYEPEIVPNTVPTVQSNITHNNNNRRQSSPNTTKALVKRSENQTVPVVTDTEEFVHIPEQIIVDKTISAGILIFRFLLNYFDC